MAFDDPLLHRLPVHPDYPLHTWQQYAFSRFSEGPALGAFSDEGGIGLKSWEQRCLAAAIEGPNGEGTVWVHRLATRYDEPYGYSIVTVSHPANALLNTLVLTMEDGVLNVEGVRTGRFDPTDPDAVRSLDELLVNARSRYIGRVER